MSPRTSGVHLATTANDHLSVMDLNAQSAPGGVKIEKETETEIAIAPGAMAMVGHVLGRRGRKTLLRTWSRSGTRSATIRLQMTLPMLRPSRACLKFRRSSLVRKAGRSRGQAREADRIRKRSMILILIPRSVGDSWYLKVYGIDKT
jgi:hypothetical protein